VNIHLALLLIYSVGIIAFGVWTARFVRGSSDFFVAGRSLGPGLLLASMLAANIGAGSTVGVAGVAYRDGISAWWWVGSAGLGSLLFAYFVAPRLWRLAAAHDFYTTGDYLEYRYGASVRAVAALTTCLGSLALLAGQLIAGAAILNVIVGVPRWVGALIGAVVMTVYFTAGGLLGSAWVNTVQLVVMLVGFAVALPFAIDYAGGASSLVSSPVPAWFGDFFYSGGPGSGWMFLFLFIPSFIISPGLIQKAYGARSERALTTGVALNAVVLMLFAFIPTLLGMAAAAAVPGITDPNAVLPTLLMTALPVWLGALALSAVFSTEVDTCDAVLFMLSTTLSKDVYQRVINPQASDAQLLRVARLAAVGGGAAGVILSIYLATVVGALTIFYSIIVVSLFVPIVGGLYSARGDATAAVSSMAAGLIALFVARFWIAPTYRWADPALVGVIAAGAVYAMVALLRRSPSHVRSVPAG
jgi:SSS family solute:Na+ symporter